MTDRWPLTPLEEYFLYEDRPAYPWSFFVRLELGGCANRQAAETALRRSVEYHPLLSSIAGRQGNGRWIWQRVEQPQPLVNWTPGPPQRAYPSAGYLDVSKEIGIRLLVNAAPDRTQLVFQFHHACCDARGAFTLIDDWLTEYARATARGQAIGAPPAYDLDWLPRRGRFPSELRGFTTGWFARWAGLKRAYRFLRQQPVPLLDYQPAGDDEPTPPSFPTALGLVFDEQTTVELREAAKRQQATVNDLLCRDLLLALNDFRVGLLPERPRAWLRLAVPVDLRPRTQQRMSAVNQASMVFITRRASECLAADALLRGIHDELRQVKTLGLARTFQRSLGIRRHLPGGLARSVRKRKCGSTAGLTNAGQILHESRLPRLGEKLVAGNLTLDTIDFLAPNRPLTCASFSACTYAGRLSINLQYDPRALGGEAADRLLTCFRDRLHRSVQ